MAGRIHAGVVRIHLCTVDDPDDPDGGHPELTKEFYGRWSMLKGLLGVWWMTFRLW